MEVLRVKFGRPFHYFLFCTKHTNYSRLSLMISRAQLFHSCWKFVVFYFETSIYLSLCGILCISYWLEKACTGMWVRSFVYLSAKFMSWAISTNNKIHPWADLFKFHWTDLIFACCLRSATCFNWPKWPFWTQVVNLSLICFWTKVPSRKVERAGAVRTRLCTAQARADSKVWS